MTAAEIIVRVLRPVLHRGERIEAGTTLKVPAHDAALLLDSGKAELAHAGDAAAVAAARRAELARVLAPAGRPRQPPQFGAAWQALS